LRLKSRFTLKLEEIISKALEKDAICVTRWPRNAGRSETVKRETESNPTPQPVRLLRRLPPHAGAPQLNSTGVSAVVAAVKQHKWGASELRCRTDVLAAAVFRSVLTAAPYSGAHFQNFTITQVPTRAGGTHGHFAGWKVVLTVINSKGLQGLWLHNLPTSSDTQ